MCGITGIFAFNLVGKFNKIHVTQATMVLEKRGPDVQDIYLEEWIALGHRRLSIIDTSAAGNQPMWDETNRYGIVFNGEIFNFQELKKELEQKGIVFSSHTDTEVLLKLFILEKEKCLSKLNGFFAFCIYDRTEQSFFLARDRYGVKPLLYTFDEDKFIFASEMKAMLTYGIEKQIDYCSLYNYLQLNYIPAPDTIFTTVKKVMPGHYLRVKRQQLETVCYYTIPYPPEAPAALTYDEAKTKFKDLLDASVQRRLIADVPLGSFLSGGIDSSVIAALARQHKPDLHTFSIGFKDEKFFDETTYAGQVAQHLHTDHTVFSLTNEDLYAHLHEILHYIDEPFGDSSAIAVYILSKETRKYATVALSGDGADELASGYNKHAAFYRIQHAGWKEKLVQQLTPVLKKLPQSRNGTISNKIRQLVRFGEGMNLSPQERYWRWAGYATNEEALHLLHPELRTAMWLKEFVPRKKQMLRHIGNNPSMNDYLLTDMELVLPNDMLAKVDSMSMANSLEVRTPFLDYEVVNFLFSLPDDYKINGTMRKRLVQDAFRDMLPEQLYNRPKKGFEVPLLKWFRHELKSKIKDDLLSEKFIADQGIFHYPAIEKLVEQLFSSNPQDVHARIWGLLVFQWWWKRTMAS